MNEKILVIEDEQDILEGIVTLLTEEGFTVFSASSGKLGITEAIINTPDLILCDILMKGMDGYEVLEKLSKHEKTRAIPLIYLTAKVERSDIRRGMELGADDYLFKPFKPEELLSAISTCLRKRSLLKANYVKTTQPVKIENTSERIFLDMGSKSTFISIDEIVYISAENQYTSIYLLDKRTLLLRKPIAFWEKTLPAVKFVKIHRSTIINLTCITKMGKSHNSSFIIYLKDIHDPFVISRRYSAELRKKKFNK